MPKYTLDSLGSDAFEQLSQALLIAAIGPGIRVYGMGADGAREATYEGSASFPSPDHQWSGKWIFQAKFHDVAQIGPSAARRQIVQDLATELHTITQTYQYACDNYILLTNVSLTPAFQRGTKDIIDSQVVANFRSKIPNIAVLGAEEICALLDANPGVRQTYAQFLIPSDIISRLLRILDAPVNDLDETVRLYCQGCLVHEEHAVLDDAGDVDDKPLPLQTVFVDLRVAPQRPNSTLGKSTDCPTWLLQAAENETRSSSLSYLFDDSVRALAVVGGPGEGKSTLGQYVAQLHRFWLLGRLAELNPPVPESALPTPRIPFRIILRLYAQWLAHDAASGSVFHYLATEVTREAGRQVTAADIQAIVKANATLLILDGLDEVPEPNLRRRVLANISAFVTQSQQVLSADMRILATTRPQGYSDEFDPTNYLHLTLQKLPSAAATEYATKWVTARESDPAHLNRILRTFSLCQKDPAVRVLTETPLQITILLVIIRARGTPPKQREELFDRYTDIIYVREQKNRPELLRSGPDRIFGIHKFFGYVLHQRAARDTTAATMPANEFQQYVEAYLAHTEPLLSNEEIRAQAALLIEDAHDRLVLIESPSAGKMGFGLTSVREFFAAAHLVDNAENTAQRDERFRAIAKLPHWRNVALFFAGRVGRTRPGEVSSMIDVCRTLDTERVDRVVNRGAQLVLEMVHERAVREPYHEIAAVQYALTLLDRGPTDHLARLHDAFSGLPADYRERAIKPWLVERLVSTRSDLLLSYTQLYIKLFGPDSVSNTALSQAVACGIPAVEIRAVGLAVQGQQTSPWCIDALNRLASPDTRDRLISTVSDHWQSLPAYASADLTPQTYSALAQALLIGLQLEITLDINALYRIVDSLSPSPDKVISAVQGTLWLSYLLRYVALRQSAHSSYAVLHDNISFRLPLIALPDVSMLVEAQRDGVNLAISSLENVDNAFVRALVLAFQYLLDPTQSDHLAKLSQLCADRLSDCSYIWHQLAPSTVVGGARSAVGIHRVAAWIRELGEPRVLELLREFWEFAGSTFTRAGHTLDPTLLLILSDFEVANSSPVLSFGPAESRQLRDIRAWLDSYNMPLGALSLCSWLRPDGTRRGALPATIAVLRQLISAPDRTSLGSAIWRLASSIDSEALVEDQARGAALREELRSVWNSVISAHEAGEFDRDPNVFSSMLSLALRTGILSSGDLARLYPLARNGSPILNFWGSPRGRAGETVLVSALDQNLEVARTAGLLLGRLCQVLRHSREVGRVESSGAVERLTALLEGDDSPSWRAKYISALTFFALPWQRFGNAWFSAMRLASSSEEIDAWALVLEMGSSASLGDSRALVELLVDSLREPGGPESLRSAALRRLRSELSIVESPEIREGGLGLPLPRRSGLYG